MTNNEDGIEWGHKMTSLLEFIEMKGWDISEWWDEHMVTRGSITITIPQTSGVRVEYHLLSEEDDYGLSHSHATIRGAYSFNDWLEEMADGEESGDGGGGRMLYADFDSLDDAHKFTLTLEQNKISHLIVEA